MMVIDPKYNIGDVVYLKTDGDQAARIVYRYLVYKESILYGLCCGTSVSEHYDFELSNEKDLSLA